MKFAAVLSFAAFAINSALAVNYTVSVGGNSSLAFSPSSITGVLEGDVVSFIFMAKNHTVTQSTFAQPCTASAGGVNSGFMPVAANATSLPQFSFVVNNVSAPFWFYCQQTGHCGSGMVFAINPTANKTFEAFQQAAEATKNSTTSGTPSGTSGGSGSGSGSGTGASGSGSASPSSKTGAAVRLSSGNSVTAAGLVLLSGLFAVAL